MKILFDQGTPVPLRRHLHPWRVDTAAEMGWSQLGNGELLAAAEAAGFDLFITTDRNLRYQQNLAQRVTFGVAGSRSSSMGQTEARSRSHLPAAWAAAGEFTTSYIS